MEHPVFFRFVLPLCVFSEKEREREISKDLIARRTTPRDGDARGGEWECLARRVEEKREENAREEKETPTVQRKRNARAEREVHPRDGANIQKLRDLHDKETIDWFEVTEEFANEEVEKEWSEEVFIDHSAAFKDLPDREKIRIQRIKKRSDPNVAPDEPVPLRLRP